MALKLITGSTGEYVYPDEYAAGIAGIVGNSVVVMENIGSACSAQIINNNTVRINDGVVFIQGKQVNIPFNTYEDFTIQSGAVGATRADIIGFTITETGISKTVINETSGIPSGSYWNGDDSIFGAMYRVVLDGSNIISVTPLFSTYGTEVKDEYPTFFNCERIIGTYAGRTEYEYIFSTKMDAFEGDPAASWTEHAYTLPFTGAERVISICGEIRSNTAHEAWALPYVSWKSGAIATHLWTLKPNGNLIVLNKGSAKWTKDYWLIITIRYTKE